MLTKYPKSTLLTIFILSLGCYITNANLLAINLSQVTIGKYFDVSINAISISNVGYTLFFSAFMMLGGRLGDHYGSSNIYIFGLLIFFIGSLLSAISFSTTIFIIGCCIQGLGIALFWPNTTSLIYKFFDNEHKGSAMALIGLVGSTANSLAPFIIGAIISLISWRCVFIANLIIGLPVLMIFILKKNRLDSKKNLNHLHWKEYSVSILACIIAFLFFPFILLPHEIIRDARGIIFILALLFAFFVILLLYKKHNIWHSSIEKKVIMNKLFFVYSLSRAALMASYLSVLYLISILLQSNYNFSSFQTGLAFLPMTITLGIVSIISGKIANKGLGKYAVSGGTFLAALAIVNISAIGNNSSSLQIIILVALFGAGLSLATPAIGSSALGCFNENIVTQVAGIYSTIGVFGATAGVSLSSFFIKTLGKERLASYLSNSHIEVSKNLFSSLFKMAFGTGHKENLLLHVTSDKINMINKILHHVVHNVLSEVFFILSLTLFTLIIIQIRCIPKPFTNHSNKMRQ